MGALRRWRRWRRSLRGGGPCRSCWTRSARSGRTHHRHLRQPFSHSFFCALFDLADNLWSLFLHLTSSRSWSAASSPRCERDEKRVAPRFCLLVGGQ
jgi:hypothetical protein